eukprot:scaffold37341_cov51-Attheya_sp.AAC.2
MSRRWFPVLGANLGGQKLSGGDLPMKPFAWEGAGFGVPGGETEIFFGISLERVEGLVEGLGVDGLGFEPELAF